MKRKIKSVVTFCSILYSTVSLATANQLETKSDFIDKVDNIIQKLKQVKRDHINYLGTSNYDDLLKESILEFQNDLDSLESLGIEHELLMTAAYTEVIDI